MVFVGFVICFWMEPFPAKGSLEPCYSIACRIAGRTRACFEAKLTSVYKLSFKSNASDGKQIPFKLGTHGFEWMS